MRSYDNIRKIATGQGDDYTTGYLLDYNYLNNWYKMIAVELSKQQALDDLRSTCTWKSKVPGSSLAASYVQRWALCSNHPANV